MTFKDKVIWITGASSGIGKALAVELSKHNCKLILSARRGDVLNEVKKECSNNHNIEVLPFDLADYQNMQEICKEVTYLS